MKLTKDIDLVPPIREPRRLWLGWAILVFLSLLEFFAMLHGRPSVLRTHQPIAALVKTVGEWVPMVQAFARCAAHTDAGSGLMLALSVLFFPFKLGALVYAHPRQISPAGTGWRAAFGLFYALLIALVALVPTYVWGWIFAPGDSGLASINRKTSALCAGGFQGFLSGMLQSGFSLAGAYLSLVIFIGLFSRLRHSAPASQHS